MNKYLVTIAPVSDENETGEHVTFAWGDFGVMNYAAKSGLKEIAGQTGDFRARIVEVESVGSEDEKRSVVSITGDAETVAVVVKRKIANEKKEQGGAADETTPDVDSADAGE